MITVECQNCRNPIETYPSRKERTKFCNRTCYAEWLSKNRSGENHHMYGKRHRPESLAKMSAEKTARAKFGKDNPRWKGGKYLSRGYVMLSLETLPLEDQAKYGSMANRSSKRAIPEHRLVMARALGRPLTSLEIVHHKNGVKDDNRIENLEIKGNSDHKKEHSQILAELRRLRGENEMLYYLLCISLSATSPTTGDTTSDQPE